MASIIRRRQLSRRALLRGAGAALALPFLSAMVPARQRELSAPIRTCFIFYPNGVDMASWRPQGGTGPLKLSPTLEPLGSHRRALTVISGLALDGGRAHGDGPGDHARASASYLTAAHPRKTGGADIKVGVSVDQMLAEKVGGATAFASLELGMEGGRPAGVCDSGYSCAYSNNISWRTESTPVPKETRPRAAFLRLFGDPDDRASAAERHRKALDRRSLLDFTLGDARRLRGRVGPADRAKLDDYLDAVRELERRLERVEAENQDHRPTAGSDVLARTGGGFEGRLDSMYEIIALAFEADLVRTVTFMLGNAGSSAHYRALGATDGHHELSHHGDKEEKLSVIRRIDRFHIEHFSGFLDRLAAMKEGSASVLDQSFVVYGSGLGNGNRHDHMDLPVLVAGGGGGRLRGGRHLVMPRHTPMANLHLALLQQAGVRAESFGDSTGPLSFG